MDNQIVNDKDGLIYYIDINSHSAKVEISSNAITNICIPHCIKYDSQEYPIKTISKCSINANAKSINFPEDSELQTIESNSISIIHLEKLFIPESVKKLGKKWCYNTLRLHKVTISPNNTNFANFNKDIIIGKSDQQSNILDTVYFVSRTASQAYIPAFIKKINAYAISECDVIGFINFPENSELEVIDDYSFSRSRMPSFKLPKTTKIIGKGAFNNCSNLVNFEIPEDSELQSICDDAFANMQIKSLYFPANLTKLGEKWCKLTPHLNRITISPKNKTFSIIEGEMIVGRSNSENDGEFDILYFVSRDAVDVTIPSNIKIINGYAFHQCAKIKTVKIAEKSKLEIIKEMAFGYCSLKRIDIPKSVTTIDGSAFYESGLEKINFDEDSQLNYIGESAFCRTHIQSISIPKHVKKIGSSAFMDCTNLEEVNFSLENEIKFIGKSAFQNTSIKHMSVPKNVEQINSFAFQDCKELESIDFEEPSSCKLIKANTFSSSGMKTLTLPSTIEIIESGWCNKTEKLTTVIVPKSNERFIVLDNKIVISRSLSPSLSQEDSDDDECQHVDDKVKVMKREDDNEFNIICFVPRDIKKVEIPKYIKYIDSYAFSNCSKLEQVEFERESELELIGYSSFSNSTISSITIPKSVKIIDDKSFSECISLESVTFQDDSELRTIGRSSFSNTTIESIIIPNSVEEIKKDVFFNCNKIKAIEFLGDSRLQCINSGFISSLKAKSIKIPNHVKSIKENAFNYCYSLETIEISEDSELTTLNKNAFYDTSIKEIYFPPQLKDVDLLYDLYYLSEIRISPKNKYYSAIDDGKILICKSDISNDTYDIIFIALGSVRHAIIPSYIKRINKYAFSKCSNMDSVEFEGNSQLEIIGEYSFYGTSIESIAIPDSVKVIEHGAFKNCSLERVDISENSELQYIESDAFKYSNNKKILIPKNVKSIGKYAFSSSKLETIEFAQDSVLEIIDENAFNDCSSINSIVIPKNVREIKDGTFSNCSNLVSVTFPEDSELQVINSHAFDDSNISSINLPQKLKELEDGWPKSLSNLTNVSVSPENQYFKCIDEKMIIYRSNLNNENYDVLSFACRDIEHVNVPSYIKEIKPYAFADSVNIVSFEFAENSELEIIGDNAFLNSVLKNGITIPKSTKIIGDHAFDNSQCDPFIIPDDSELYQIGINAFKNTSIEIFEFPQNIKYFSLDFLSGHYIKEIILPDSLELIDSTKFEELSVEKINIPAKINDIQFLFHMKQLTEIHISPNNKYYASINNELIVKKSDPNNDVYDVICYSLPHIKKVFIPSYITKIDVEAFSNRQDIDSIEFEKDSQLQIIEKLSFANSPITEISIPKHVKSIGYAAFSNCINLQKVIFAEDLELEIIDQNLFSKTALIKIDIPKSVKIINNFAFAQSSLQEINFDEDSQLNRIRPSAFSGTHIRSITIPKHVKYIESAVFLGCTNLEEVNFSLENEIKFIGKSAFQNTSIKHMSVPKNVEQINSFAFQDCKELESIDFEEPSSCKLIKANTFSSSGIKTLTLPSTIEIIESGWCNKTEKLTTVIVPKSNERFIVLDNKIVVSRLLSPPSILFEKFDDDFDYNFEYDYEEKRDHDYFYIEDFNYQKFGGDGKEGEFNVICFVPRDIKKVEIPKYIKYIDSYAFSNCSKLEQVEFERESELELIGYSSFSNSTISSITIPKSVKIIGVLCFYKCYDLKKVNLDPESKVAINSNAFDLTSIKDFMFPKEVIKLYGDAFGPEPSLESVEFLCDTFYFKTDGFLNDLLVVSFPNAKKVSFVIYEERLKGDYVIFTLPLADVEIDIWQY